MIKLRQKGLSPIGFLFVVAVFAFTVMVTLKLSTVYMQYNTIKGSFKDVAELPGIKEMGSEAVKSSVSKAFSINSISDFDIDNEMYVDKDNHVFGFEYERRIHMFLNIDVVLSFAHDQEMK